MRQKVDEDEQRPDMAQTRNSTIPFSYLIVAFSMIYMFSIYCYLIT